MESIDVYGGGAAAFEGDTTLVVRSLPVGAIVKRATLTVAPVAPPGGRLFEERVDFAAPADASRTLGATKLASGGFAEVDFHKRRTLAAVAGTAIDQAGLQVDLGGVYVEINDKGAILTPSSAPFKLTGGTLPGLTVAKFKLTTAAGTPDVTSVTIRTVPSNVTLRLGKTAPFWTHAGELATAVTTPDFATLLQTFVANAATDNGYVLLPVAVHSDTLARLTLTLRVTYLGSAAATPNGLGEAVMPYGAATVTDAPVPLAVSLPPDARVVAGDTTARVTGQFASTRIVEGYGAPTGAVTVAGTGTVTPASSLAQIAAFPTPVSASAIDLSLTGVSRTAKLALDLRADLDGKPDGTSLLGGPVPFTFQSLASPAPGWITVPLAKEFHFASTGPAKYWIVLQSLDGEVQWNLAVPAQANAASPAPPVQQSTPDGLSWRAAVLATGAAAQAGALAALYRLRYQPARYEVPIEMQVGAGDAAIRIKLDRYQPLGRVDFTLDAPEVASGFNAYLSATPPASCASGEHLANGDFRLWNALGGGLGAPNAVASDGATGMLTVSADGQSAYAGTSNGNARGVSVIDTVSDSAAGTIAVAGTSDPVFAAASSDGMRIYAGTTGSLHVLDASSDADFGAITDRDLDGPRLGALSPDGTNLFVASATRVQKLSTAALDDAARLSTAIDATASASAADTAGLAVSADGTTLFVADNPGAGRVRALFTASLQLRAELSLGTQLAALAITADGTQLVALDALAGGGASLAWIVDAASLAVSGSIALPAGTPAAIAIAPDGARAYVALRAAAGSPLTIATLDLARRTVVGAPLALPAGTGTATTSSGPVTLAMTPAGDRLYAADGALRTLTAIPVGTRVPSDWAAFGAVQPARFGGTTAVVIGDIMSVDNAADAGVSQVVPVASGCRYVFSFAAESAAFANGVWRRRGNPTAVGYATKTPVAPVSAEAHAEVIWLNAQCGPARTDGVPIAQSLRSETLTPYRTALTAPPGATQAEVRFRAGPGSAIALGSVSLAGTADAVTNGDFQQLGTDGVPTGWTTTPASARVIVADASGTAAGATDTDRARLLRNAGARPLELTQSVDVPPSALLDVDFAGRVSGAVSANGAVPAEAPAIAIAFTASDGSPVGTSSTLALDAGDFDRHPAQLAVPSGAARASVTLRLPPSSALAVQRFALRFASAVNVPIAFVAQAPGELRISRAAVAYDRVPAPPPPIPPAGLCTPTPPSLAPGEMPSGDGECHCMQCGAQRKTQNAAAATTAAGRPITIATCTVCGGQTIRYGGPAMMTDARVPLATVVNEFVARDVATTRSFTAQPYVAARSIAGRPLTDVVGIGAARASMLQAIGITSLEQLATANPADVANALSGVTTAMAAGFVKQAQTLTSPAPNQ